MMTSSRVLSVVLIVAVSACLALRAADDAPPTRGKVLILENERTLEGDIEKHGDQYRVRRAVGETWIAADKVLQLCATREDAYRYLRQRANLADPDERLRLAQWCHLNGLRYQAFSEVTAAVELRPNHPESKRLLRNLQRASTPAAIPALVEKKPVATVAAPTPPIELTNDSLSLFVTKVQPVFMNACANCHASERAAVFKLTRAFEGGAANRKTVQGNLASALAQISVEIPESSPLLIKAVSVHGDMVQPPLKGRQAPAYRLIEDWVQFTLTNNPQLRNRSAAALPFVTPEIKPAAEVVPAKSELPGKPPAPNPKEAEKPGPTGDAYDPAVFNRQMHPDKK